jgi:hypothetical protein
MKVEGESRTTRAAAFEHLARASLQAAKRTPDLLQPSRYSSAKFGKSSGASNVAIT